MKSSFFRTSAILALVAGLCGCATVGKNFPTDKVKAFELGRTTKSEVIAQLGAPENERTFTAKKDISGGEIQSPTIVQVLEYFYAEPGSTDRVLPGIVPGRTSSIFLVDDVLRGYYLGSSFKSDSTDFDLANVSAIVKNKTTEAEVIAMLGAPSGRGNYPLAHSPSGRSIFYTSVLRNHPAGSTTTKKVSVQLSKDGVVEDFSVNSTVDAIPVAPAPTPIFIYMPPISR